MHRVQVLVYTTVVGGMCHALSEMVSQASGLVMLVAGHRNP